MRNIIFRGKALSNGEWVFGDLLRWQVKGETQWHIVDYADIVRLNNHRVDPETVGQFTGLCDKNGQEICEGDVIQVVALSNDHHQRGATTILIIKYFMGNPCLCCNGYETGVAIYPFCVDHLLEVIGNSTDNPDLLKEAKQCLTQFGSLERL